MAVSRRSFVATLGTGTAGLIAAPLLNWRGHEALFAQGTNERQEDRLLASQPGMIRIDSNENPNGPGQRVFEAVTKHFRISNRYPVKEPNDLVATIAKLHGVQPANVILGCGSGELLRAAVFAFTSPTKALVAPEPTFESPANFAKFLSHPVSAPPVTSKLALDLDAMADASKNSGLIYFCNPNNPTATVHSKSDVVAFIDRVNHASPDTTILVDEAYHEYVEDKSYGSVVQLAVSNPRVVVTRTFSKVFGMAGLRAGYAIGQPDTLKKMSAWLLGSNVNQLAIAAASIAIVDTAHIASEQKKNAESRAMTRKFFQDAGYTVHAADANFMMVDVRRDAKAFKLDCAKHKVAIGRQFPAVPNYARISFGTVAEMKKALPVFKAVLANTVSTSH
jgi:histidinol-phosphate aminotransferase